ncbi:MAG: metal-dependent hydrolase [Candidatus Nanohaloarchaea archaeon]|nr:metal-dependent hydrolase [Candidatus Nanohaloarchaea archaeon]
MIGFTHLVFALALVHLSGFPVIYGAVAGIFPDIDILFNREFPISHRGILHTPLAAVFLSALLYLATGRRSHAYSFFTGYVSHLFLDTFTYSGIHWLYPVKGALSFEAVGYASIGANLGISALSLFLASGWSHRSEVRGWMS